MITLMIISAVILFFVMRHRALTVPEETRDVDGVTYRLTFFDDFEGERLNPFRWQRCPEYERQDVGGRWDDSCARLDGEGHLVLAAELREDGTPISGAVRTAGRFEQAGGYFEVRCKLQQADGFWGAFWLMCDGEKKVGNGATDGAEIDIFESCGVGAGQINHAIHWDGYGDDHRMSSHTVGGTDCYDGEYHTFGLLWTEDAYIFYMDGRETWRLSASDADFPGSCTEACYLKLTTEFGSWAGEYSAESLPDSVVIDYVKVYQRVN